MRSGNDLNAEVGMRKAERVEGEKMRRREGGKVEDRKTKSEFGSQELKTH